MKVFWKTYVSSGLTVEGGMSLLLRAGGVGSIPAIPDTRRVPCFSWWNEVYSLQENYNIIAKTMVSWFQMGIPRSWIFTGMVYTINQKYNEVCLNLKTRIFPNIPGIWQWLSYVKYNPGIFLPYSETRLESLSQLPVVIRNIPVILSFIIYPT